MAVETNKDSISPTQTLTGMVAVNGGRRKRTSALLMAASALPSVENSLDDFIARANQTLSDPTQWNAAEVAAKAQNEARREADTIRIQATEHRLHESEAREGALRRQLDGLQGRLAEAEARAAVANTGSQDGVIADLKLRLTRADERIGAAEDHANQLAQELVAAKTKSMTAQAPAISAFSDEDADERVRIAEAKAAKALAAAKAAAAGLTVNPADIAAIESGLFVPSFERKSTNWLAVAGAFVGGLAIMFGVSKAIGGSGDKSPPAPAQQQAQVQAVQPQQAAPVPAPAPTPRPTVTPIEDPPAQTIPDNNATVQPPVPTHAGTAPSHASGHTAAVSTAPVKKSTPTQAPATAPASGGDATGIADPFGDGSAPKKAPAKAPAKQDAKKSGGSIVDPF